MELREPPADDRRQGRDGTVEIRACSEPWRQEEIRDDGRVGIFDVVGVTDRCCSIVQMDALPFFQV